MRVLLVGATGKLGSRLIPALRAHGHTVVAFVRSSQRLQDLLPADLTKQVTIVECAVFDPEAVRAALSTHDCDAVVHVAGSPEPLKNPHLHGQLVATVTAAAIEVGKARGSPLRAWIVGGLGSLQYPGTQYQIQDYMPGFMTVHHRGTEAMVKGIPTTELRWSLLCVAMMYPESEEIRMLPHPSGNSLVIGAKAPPAWQDHWIRNVPLLGTYLNLVPAIQSYSTELEDVADLIAETLTRNDAQYVGQLLGMKKVRDKKAL